MSFPIEIFRSNANEPVIFENLYSLYSWVVREKKCWDWLSAIPEEQRTVLYNDVTTQQLAPLIESFTLVQDKDTLDSSEVSILRDILTDALQNKCILLKNDEASIFILKNIDEPLYALGILAQAIGITVREHEPQLVLAGRQHYEMWKVRPENLRQASRDKNVTNQKNLTEQFQSQEHIQAVLRSLENEARRNAILCRNLLLYISAWVLALMVATWFVHQNTMPEPSQTVTNTNQSNANKTSSTPPAAQTPATSANPSSTPEAKSNTSADKKPDSSGNSNSNTDNHWNIWLDRAPLYLLLFSALAWGLRLFSRLFSQAWTAEQACCRRITNLQLVLADKATQILVRHENEKDQEQIRLDVFGIRDQGGGQSEQENLFEGVDKLSDAIKKLRETLVGQDEKK